MSSATLDIARVETDPTVGWRFENKTIPASEPVFSRATLKARTAGCLVPISVELFEDASNSGAEIERVIAVSLAAAIDRVCLVGAGSASEPLGVLNTSGVNTVTSVGTPTTWVKYVNAVTECLKDNETPNALILHPRDDGILAALLDTTNQPMRRPDRIQELQVLTTTTLPTTQGAGAESSAIVGDFTQLLIGVRREISLSIDRSLGFAEFQLQLRGIARVDCLVARPSAFCVLSGITIT